MVRKEVNDFYYSNLLLCYTEESAVEIYVKFISPKSTYVTCKTALQITLQGAHVHFVNCS